MANERKVYFKDFKNRRQPWEKLPSKQIIFIQNINGEEQ
jgi:hypothetical protein